MTCHCSVLTASALRTYNKSRTFPLLCGSGSWYSWSCITLCSTSSSDRCSYGCLPPSTISQSVTPNDLQNHRTPEQYINSVYKVENCCRNFCVIPPKKRLHSFKVLKKLKTTTLPLATYHTFPGLDGGLVTRLPSCWITTPSGANHLIGMVLGAFGLL